MWFSNEVKSGGQVGGAVPSKHDSAPAATGSRAVCIYSTHSMLQINVAVIIFLIGKLHRLGLGFIHASFRCAGRRDHLRWGRRHLTDVVVFANRRGCGCGCGGGSRLAVGARGWRSRVSGHATYC